MQAIARNVLESIGDTPIVELRKLIPAGSARVLAKLEFANPTGSMKDRMAKAAIEGAEAAGRLGPGGTVVEYTAGTTGVSLALVCAVKGYQLKAVFSDAFSDEKRRMMEAFGAHISDAISDQKKITESLIKAMILRAAEISASPGHWYCDHLNNTDTINGYRPLGEEIWAQTAGRVDAFVHAVGTAHAIHGATQALWAHRPEIRTVAVEPQESAVLSGGPSGAHQIEGMESASCRRCASLGSSTRSRQSRRAMQRRWRAALRERKGSSPAHRLARTWWPPFTSRSACGRARRW